MKCSSCGGTDSVAYMVIGNVSICMDCKKKHGEKLPESKKKDSGNTRFFTQYVCRTHNCGTCNINQMARHIMDECDTYERVIPHWHKPRTFGGYNGDINRRYYVTRKDVLIKLLARWNRFRKDYRKRVFGDDGKREYGGDYSDTSKRSKRKRSRSYN